MPQPGDPIPSEWGQTGTVTRAEMTDPGEAPVAPPHPVIPAWVEDLVAAVLIVIPAFVPFPGQEFRPTGWAVWLVVLVPAVVLPFRRRWPVPVLGICLALFGAASAMGTLSPGATVAACVAMFGVANRSSRRTALWVGSVTAVLILILAIPAAPGSVFDARVLQFGLAVGMATAAGDGARSRRAYIQAITERAERAEATREAEARRRVTEERLRIARDLHDTVAHQIAVISLNAGVASSALTSSPDRAASALGTIRQASRAVLSEIGDLLTMLRADDPVDATTTPQYGTDQLQSLLEQFEAAGLDVHTRVDGDLGRVTGAVGNVTYRVVQEALTNAHKHGAEHRAHLLLEVAGQTVRIVVSNPIAPAAAPDMTGSGMGLIGVRERVASVRGQVAAGPAPGGFKLTAAIPLPGSEDSP